MPGFSTNPIKDTTDALQSLISPLKQYFLKDTFNRSDIDKAPPLRAELYTVEQFGFRATDLARAHSITDQKAPEQLLKRLADNEEVLIKVIDLLQEAILNKTPVSPAGEWLLDNFYLIEEQILLAKKHLPKGYSRGLPALRTRSADHPGFPRVYEIAIEIISHSDGHLDIPILNKFIESYQTQKELTLGELWAIPIMLRLALIENLRRVAANVAIDRIDANVAHQWADLIIETAEKDPKNLVLTIADMARSNPPMVTAFIAEYSRKLQWKGVNLTLPLSWIELHLSETGETINGMVLAENRKQAADHVSMSNSIKSLRFLAKTDWRKFVEAHSLVEKTLKLDKGNVYARMDFHTRDEYRHVVERIAKQTKMEESEVARTVIQLADESGEEESCATHVGYFLIGAGLAQTENVLKSHLPFSYLMNRMLTKYAPALYTIGSLLATSVMAAGLFQIAAEVSETGLRYLLYVLSVLGASQAGIAFINWIATLRVNPSLLPRMDFSAFIPEDFRTMVVIPTLLSGSDKAEKLAEGLEVRYLGNRDPNLLFALLTDFGDAEKEVMPDDDRLSQKMVSLINHLNKKYGTSARTPFFLFHRPRRLNTAENKWMGHERKRGKLGDLNALLKGTKMDPFSIIIGDQGSLSKVKYIITLDTDTQLPRDSAGKLIGVMAHPLNRPVYDEIKKRIVKGYGIIQPRVAIRLHASARSRYASVYENDVGIDPYTRVISDVYQDIFGEGSFIGKGIYEIDAFEKVLSNRFPENKILSHDLLEGCYMRSGFASDIQLYEDGPGNFGTDTSRRHRWIRGDWQIGNWILPWVPDQMGKLSRNPISALSRWKIADNLRRSLIPVALFLMLVLGWTFAGSPGFWTFCVLTIAIIPAISMSGWHLMKKPKETDATHHAQHVLENFIRNLIQVAFQLVCLPYEVFINLDAIFRTIARMVFTHRNLLEWNPSGQNSVHEEHLVTICRKMLLAPLTTMMLLFLVSIHFPDSLLLATPFLVAWGLSPFIVFTLGLPVSSTKSSISESQKIALHILARKTWAFFEKNVTKEENWLPPDNIQEYPVSNIAHRTSPTNIGLSLLSNLAAHDFGYITLSQLTDRTAKTFQTLSTLERYAGHLFNWYDTRSLTVLHPRYVSTVDSGNFAGHLITLQQGLLEIQHVPVLSPRLFAGLHDTLRLHSSYPAGNEPSNEILRLLNRLDQPLIKLINELPLLFEELAESVNRFFPDASLFDFPEWKKSLIEQIEAWQGELKLLVPVGLHERRPEKFKGLNIFSGIPSLWQLIKSETTFEKSLSLYQKNEFTSDEVLWITQFKQSLRASHLAAAGRIAQIETLIVYCEEFSTMEYDFLYDKSQHLLSIGYNADEHRPDPGFYDLLASEARLGLFVAIARGKIPQESWFALGRRLTSAEGNQVLLSWSGSMFEYLMPNIVMPVYDHTLLEETCQGAVKKQIGYGREHGIPWGISESCYNMVDANLAYQYKAFGIPELGFKRGLGLDLVLAPYASVMALMVDPSAACHNLEKMRAKGYEGKYGFFEAIDHSPSRLPRSKEPVVIQSFMAHHLGMSLLSLDAVLCHEPMQRRFEANADFQTALLLLQERIPQSNGVHLISKDSEGILRRSPTNEFRIIQTPATPWPEIQLLSNGHYHVMISNSGGGYSRYKDLAITRWREDAVLDNWGSFCYVRDLESGKFWSNTYQPTLKEATFYESIFSQGRVEFRRVDDEIESYTEIIVSPEDNVEIRRVRITNQSRSTRKIELTSYGEVVIASPGADDAHAAFSNLFVQTEILTNQQALLCTRRPRSREEKPPWIFHLMKIHGVRADHISFETDRFIFTGRGNNLREPQAMKQTSPLSNTQGPVLDPIIAIQFRITLEPGKTATIDIITGIGETRENCQSLVDKYQDRNFRNRAFELTWTHSQVVLRQINATEADSQLFNHIASSILYANPTLRAGQDVLAKNYRNQSFLWSYALSGDLPLLLLQVSESNNLSLIKQVMQARAYWLFKGLVVDILIINEDHSGYRQVLQDQIQSLIAASTGLQPSSHRGSVIVRLADQLTPEDRILLQSVARVILSDTQGTLFEQVNRKKAARNPLPYLIPRVRHEYHESMKTKIQPLLYNNGQGGFSSDGTEYVISTGESATPLPWSNVISNPAFGTLVTESGPVYTWFENAHGFRLTPWNNDPVANTFGEAFYLRDEESGHVWSPTPYPAKGSNTYVTRHGFGYTIFETHQDGIHTELKVFVDQEVAVKYSVLKIRNLSGRIRSLSATGYVAWVLGSLRPTSVMHVVTELDVVTGALIARNPFNIEFPEHVAFFDANGVTFQHTADRKEFIGRNGTMANPDGLKRLRLSGNHGPGLDPCAVIQIPFVLNPDQDREITFRLGAGRNIHDIRNLLPPVGNTQRWHEVQNYWRKTLGQTKIRTPEPALNILANGWLMYQVISCRLWGRTGFYQSGGAFGFRDQLQDVLAILHTAPEIARKHILLSASRQFREGDVQHWWHPPQGRGVRTKCSDDLLWLAFTTSRYVEHTNDIRILEEVVPFLEGRELNHEEESSYDLPTQSMHTATLYEHGKQAILKSLHFGEHGLPLMGSGDWNDGMNNVGIGGKGESVWLGFFLFDVLSRFVTIAAIMHDDPFIQTCRTTAGQLKKNIDLNAWDGNWYRRAWFDDGSLLGSAGNQECRIDSVSQSWSVLSGAAEINRSIEAMASASASLVDKDHSLIRLLDPPFDHSEKDPGYIKGYLPGIRENGGQYSHAAIWMAMAFAKLNNSKQAWELLHIINPIPHGQSAHDISIYKAEPYVIAADVYGVAPHIGRGGWTWYTGSAGWMYQLVLGSLLGLSKNGDVVRIAPCLPVAWNSFGIDYEYAGCTYAIEVTVTTGTPEVAVDGKSQPGDTFRLLHDGQPHRIEVTVNRQKLSPVSAKKESTDIVE